MIFLFRIAISSTPPPFSRQVRSLEVPTHLSRGTHLAIYKRELDIDEHCISNPAVRRISLEILFTQPTTVPNPSLPDISFVEGWTSTCAPRHPSAMFAFTTRVPTLLFANPGSTEAHARTQLSGFESITFRPYRYRLAVH